MKTQVKECLKRLHKHPTLWTIKEMTVFLNSLGKPHLISEFSIIHFYNSNNLFKIREKLD